MPRLPFEASRGPRLKKKRDRHGLIPRGLIVDKSLSPGELRFLAFLCTFTRHKTDDPLDGWAWPSQRTIAEGLGVSRRYVRNLVKKLSGKGDLLVRLMIEIDPGYSGDHRTLAYRVGGLQGIERWALPGAHVGTTSSVRGHRQFPSEGTDSCLDRTRTFSEQTKNSAPGSSPDGEEKPALPWDELFDDIGGRPGA